LRIYCIDIDDVWEVDEGIVGVDSVVAGHPIGVSREVALLIMILILSFLPVFMRTKAKMNIVRPKRAPMMVQRMSVFFLSLSTSQA
jgi:hypothetical protein